MKDCKTIYKQTNEFKYSILPQAEESMIKKWGKRIAWITIYVVFILILTYSIYSNIKSPNVFEILGIIVIIAITLIALIIHFFASNRDSNIYEIGCVQNVIGYDFGNDFRLLKTVDTQGHEEYIYQFSDDAFEPLKQHLESIPDEGDFNSEMGHVVRHKFKHPRRDYIIDFYLHDSRMKYHCGNIEWIEVNYEKKMLTHVFVIY